jgi:hypothetical protein
MMKIVKPLCVEALAAVIGRTYDSRAVEIAFRNQVKSAPRMQCPFRDCCMHEIPQVDGIAIEDLMDGIQAKAVEMIVLRPIQGIADDIFFYSIRPGAIEIQIFPPRGMIHFGQIGAKTAQAIAFRPQMVIHYVQENSYA